ncbi:MAG: oligosaccharide flippase family protein, partial [Bacteroidia bacterium]|nr:oligosaccharide flippase family protein [Bacteroidia bacterium]
LDSLTFISWSASYRQPRSACGFFSRAFTALLETIRNGFIRNPFITYFVSAENEDRDRFIASSFWLHGLVAVVMSVFLVAFGGLLTDFWDAQPLDQLCLVYAITSLLLVPYLQFEYLMQSALRFDGIFMTNAIKLSLLSIYIIVLFIVKRPPNLVELAVVQLVSVGVTLAISYGYVKSMLNVSFRPDRKLMNTLFHFGKYTFGTTISSMAIKSTDSWMIGRMLSTTAVAMYNPALRISNLVEVPTLAISNLVFPQVHKRMQQEGDKGIQDIYYKSVGLILAVMLPMVIPMYVFAEFIIVTILVTPIEPPYPYCK